MGFELDGIIKGVLYNKDGTVDYVFDDVKLDEIIVPVYSTDVSDEISDRGLFLSSKDDYGISFTVTDINETVLYHLGAIRWYDWWNGDKVEYDLEVIK